MAEAKLNEFSLPDALDMLCLPTSVITSRKCLLSGGFVLEAGMNLTVLQRQCVKLLFGKDWHGNIFRLNTQVIADLYVDIVDEIYPTDLKEVQEHLPNISYILSKVSQDVEFFKLDSGELFKDLNRIKIITSEGQNLYLSLESLLSKDLFVFVHCKKTISLEELLSTDITPGTIIRFINNMGFQVPPGNVVVDGVHVYESILTVSKLVGNQSKLLYQIFQLDSGIKVFISNEPMSTYVLELGKFSSDEYQNRIKAIMFSIYYDIYSPLFYGQLLINTSFENQKVILQNKENDFIESLKGLTSKPVEKIEHKVKEVAARPTSLFLPVWNRMSLNKKNRKKKVTSLHSSPTIEEFSPVNCVFQMSDDFDDFSKSQNELIERAVQRKIRNINKPIQKLNFKSEDKSDALNIHTVTEKSAENLYYDWENVSKKINIPLEDEESYASSKNALKFSKSFEEKSFRSFFSGRPRNKTESNLKSSFEKNIDSGIDSPDIKEREIKSFEQYLDSSTKNNSFTIEHCTESKEYNNESLKTLVDGKKEAFKKKLSKSDTSLAESIGTGEENLHEYINSSRSTKELSSDYMSVAYSCVKPRKCTNDLQKRELESLEEIHSCSIEDIVRRLHGLQLGKFEKEFKSQMINGRLLSNLSEDALHEIGLSHFEARKLYKYVHGWRVNTVNCCKSLEDALVTEWSVNDVKKIMRNIKINQLGIFAVENQIDGYMLEDLIRNNYIKTLENDHGIRLQIVEIERLRGYVYKEIKYKEHEIAKPGSTSKK